MILKTSTRMSLCQALRRCARLLVLAAAICGVVPADAGGLRVEPILLEVSPPASASTLTLRNDEGSDVNIQIRVFKWSQANGKESLEPTTDVVASPPALKLAPGLDYLVRIVRVSKQTPQAEESYRIFVDQLPAVRTGDQQQVNVLIRQSIPVFFSPPGARPNITWALAYKGTQLVVTAQNTGAKRVRVASLALRDSAGRTVSFGTGLVGYVLAHATMAWTAPSDVAGFGVAGSVEINALAEGGPLHAVAPAPIRR